MGLPFNISIKEVYEAWAKRRYAAHFVSELTDADGEDAETDTSLDMAHDCGTITDAEHAELCGGEVGRRMPRPGLLRKDACSAP